MSIDAYLSPELESRLQTLLTSGQRRVLGLVGPPGAGKSTLAERLLDRLGSRAQLVPMDGFHLAQVELERLGRAHRKGAPDTFDAHGYVQLLNRLRQQAPDEVIYAPAFRREIEEPVAGSIAVQPQTQLIITEGNYLLLDAFPWNRVAACLDEVWYVSVDEHLRRQRLVDRHVRFGRTPQAALAWVEQTDEPNARLIEQCRPRAHAVCSL